MKYVYILVGCFLFLSSCAEEEKPKEWVYQKTVKLDGVNPIGIANVEGQLWLSDGDHNRLVEIDENGSIKTVVDSVDRPMHIDTNKDVIYVPQYGNDKVELFYSKSNTDETSSFKRETIAIANDSLDAPSGVAVLGKELAITDFYNNRILYNDGKNWISFGKEGKKQGEFYYPTDIQLTDSLIWVADAYNNRIQVFDKAGSFVKMMGQNQKMNAATGLFVAEKEVFITDFENNRLLIFNHEGVLKQELKKGIKKATDVLIKDNVLHIINYRSGELVLYHLQEIKHD